MRYTIPLALISATLLVGCHSASPINSQTKAPAVSAKPAFHSILIDTFVSTPTPKYGRWMIGVTPPGHYIDFAYHELPEDGWSASVWSIITPDGWKVHPGWFAFIESESRAWAYDGDRLLILDIETPRKKATYSSRFPYAVPPEVFSRLSKEAQEDIKKHE
jgi:hypothetical protein